MLPSRQVACLQLLGVPRLTRPDGSSHALERKDAALLARLALEGPCPRATLAAWLWPLASAAGARSNLRQRVSRLRRHAAARLFSNVDPLALDPAVAHDLPLRPDAGLDSSALAAPRLLAAWDYADHTALHEWVTQAGATIAARQRRGLAQRINGLESAGDTAQALALASALWAAQPLDESALRLLMRLQHRRGDRAAAVAAFDRCATLLRAELDAEPAAETRHLLVQIKADDGAAPAGTPQPLSLLRPPRLVGRQAELAALHDTLSAGRVAVLLGEPGVGKSRLMAELAGLHEDALCVGCRPGDEQVPYALLSRLLRAALRGALAQPLLDTADTPDHARQTLTHLLPECGPAPPQRLRPAGLVSAVTWALLRQAPDVGRTVIIDDLQFADLASLELLPLLLDTQATPPLRWLLALRAAEVPALLQAWLADAAGETAQTLHLGPLDGARVETLLLSLGLSALDAGLWAGTLHRHTGGNPLFLLQTLIEVQRGGSGLGGARAMAALGATLPTADGTRALLARRIQQLGGLARSLVQVAALAGQDFDVGLAAAALQRQPLDLADAWHQLETAHLMHGERFAHDLIAEAALRSVPAASAPGWHQHIASHLARHGGALPRVAAHWRAAGCWAQAGRAFADAAAQIRQQLRSAEEAALLQQAADCHAAAGEHEAEAQAVYLLYRAQWARHHRQGLRDCVARLQRLPPSPRTTMWGQVVAGTVGFDERQDEASLALMTAARQAAQALDDPEMVLWLLGWEAGSWSLLNRPQQALQAVQQILLRVGQMPPMPPMPQTALACSALQQAGVTLELCGEPLRGLPLIEQAEARYRVLGEPIYVASCQNHQSVAHYHLGHLDRAEALLASGRRAVAQLSGGKGEPNTTEPHMARYWREQGRLGDALALMLDVHARAVAAGEPNLPAICGIEAGLSYVLLGQPHRARAYVDAPRRLGKVQVRVDGLLLEAQLARAAGQPAMALLQQALALAPQCPRAERWRWWVQLELARDMAPAEAVALLSHNLAEAEQHSIWSAAGPTRLMLIDAHLRAGQPAPAHRHALALDAALATRAAITLYAGEYTLLMCRAFQAAGDLAAARRVLQQGLDWVERVRREEVPAEFQQSFVERNPVNRQLRALAQHIPA